MLENEEKTEIIQSRIKDFKDFKEIPYKTINLPTIKLEREALADLSITVFNENVKYEESINSTESLTKNTSEILFEAVNCRTVKNETKVKFQRSTSTAQILDNVETNDNEEISSSCEPTKSTIKEEQLKNNVAQCAGQRNPISVYDGAECEEKKESHSLDTVPQDCSISRVMNKFVVSHSTVTKDRHYRRRNSTIAKQRVQKTSNRSITQKPAATSDHSCQFEEMANDVSSQNISGRSKRKISDSFIYDEEKCLAYCRLRNCNYSAKKHCGNQRRHVQNKHPDEYKEYLSLTDDIDSDGQSSTELDDYKKLKQYTLSRVALTADTIRQGLLKLVTINGRSLSIIDVSGLRMILDPIIESLPKNDKLIVTQETLKYYINEEAKRIKNSIKAEIKKYGLVSLKVDVARHDERSFLAVNVQFIVKEEIVVRTLGIVEIIEKQNFHSLKKLIIDIVTSFDLPVQNIYTFTTDNDSSIVKICSTLEETQSILPETMQNSSMRIHNYSELADLQDKFGSYVKFERSTDETIFIDESPKISEEQDLTKILSSCESLDSEDLKIPNIPCVALTLQNAIEDAIVTTKIARITKKAREAVKYFCKNSIIEELRKLRANIVKPNLDSPKNWQTTYDMFVWLISLRDFASKVKHYLTSTDWQKIEEYVLSLKPAITAMKKLQTEELLLTDFYVTWLSCAAQTKRVSSELSRNIVASMEQRQKKLFENDTFVAAIFLDPLTNAALLGDLKIRATKHLLKLWEIYYNLRSRDCSVVSGGDDETATTTKQDAEKLKIVEIPKIDLDDDVVRFLNEARKINKNTRSQNLTLRDIRPQLQKFFDDENRIVQENLLKYWTRNKFSMPELYKLSKIVLAVPAGQKSFERLHCELKFISENSSDRVIDDNLMNVVFVRCNYKVFGS